MRKNSLPVLQKTPLADGALIGRLVRMFRALCDTNRLELLARLVCCESTQNVGDVASCCPMDLSVVSRHLAAMREAGILKSERRGKEVHYAVNTQEIANLLRGFVDLLEGCWPTKKSNKRRKV